MAQGGGSTYAVENYPFGRMPYSKIKLFAPVFLLLTTLSVFSANTWFVATNGSDSNAGDINHPFATIMHAQAAANTGDTVFLRGGTYFLTVNNITATNKTGPYAIVNNITKNGISYIAQPGELPVFDFTGVNIITNRITAFLAAANNCVFKGFDVVGVQITIPSIHTQSECFRVTGNNNRFEQLRMHDGRGIGWYLTDGANNLVLNCDAYNNRGIDGGSIGNIDGFGCHPGHTSGTGNVISGCRSWFNSDDGYDCINAFAVVTFTNCWSMYNGYFTNFANSGGDANGIKAGGYGDALTPVPNPVPHHIVEYCMTVSNRANGFYANHHASGQVWLNNTAYRNDVNYDMICNIGNTNTGDVPGFDHVMKNNLGFAAKSHEVFMLGNAITNDISYNYFTLPVSVSSADFQGFDASQLTLPRQTNGNLPYIAFAQLVSTSDLVDAGTNDGFAFVGAAPDLGAFEYGARPAPVVVVTTPGTDVVVTATGGPAGGTNYLFSSTDATLPFSQWTQTTYQFDLTGSYSVTNAISSAAPQEFYRLSLP
jgi:pectate lyase